MSLAMIILRLGVLLIHQYVSLMKFKSITILALAVFLVSLIAAPAFAGNNIVRPVRGSCAVRRAQPGTIYVSAPEDKYITSDCSSFKVKCISNPIQGALHAVGSIFESREEKECRIVSNYSSRCIPRYCP